MIKKCLRGCLVFFLSMSWLGLFSDIHAYVLGMKSFDNTVENIVKIEKEYWIYLPIVSFIYDPREQWNVPGELEKMKQLLGEKRIYHLTISPNSFNAQEVIDGSFDSQYLTFFHTVKKLGLRVIFRTMHEMNGGWYPWSWDPQSFQKAWIHIWELSRQVGLDQHQILFDFSVNARDLPAKGKPSQTASFIHCEPERKVELGCVSMEDYYPGDEYVDVIGFTFYNWGKGNSNRWRGSPDRIVNNQTWKTLQRVKGFWKPIFVDEVATTAVTYAQDYDYQTSLKMYQEVSHLKDAWLRQLKDFLLRESGIVGAVYFNIDLTNGLTHQIIGELDRAVINLSNGKFYEGFWDLYSNSEVDLHSVLDLFGLEVHEVNRKTFWMSSLSYHMLSEIQLLVEHRYPAVQDQATFYAQLAAAASTHQRFNEVIAILAQAYAE